jgi:hypothetical protein
MAVDVEHVRPGERNPIEGKFGQAKTAYGMNRIKARLQQTSESWIATIVLVLNLIKLIGMGAYCQILSGITYSAILLKIVVRLIKKKMSAIWSNLYENYALTYSADPNYLINLILINMSKIIPKCPLEFIPKCPLEFI